MFVRHLPALLLTLFVGAWPVSAFTQQTHVELVPATQSAMIQADGLRGSVNGGRYFNVEGNNKGRYACYGVLRFDTATLKSAFSKSFAGAKYTITGITLELTQSHAPFTGEGAIVLYASPDASTSLTAPADALKYPYNPTGSLLRGEKIATGKFTVEARSEKEGKEGSDGKPSMASGKAKAANDKPSRAVSRYDLLQGKAGQALRDRLMGGKTVTLILTEGDPSVAATWFGSAGPEASIPHLVVRASAPGLRSSR